MEDKKAKLRDQIGNFITRPIIIITTIVAIAILSYKTGALGYFLGIFMAFITFWAKHWDWNYFGISKPNWIKSMGYGLLYAVAIYIGIDIMIQPFFEIYFGEIDLTSLNGIRGDFLSYLIFIIFMWIVAAIGEEFLYRGYIQKRLAVLLGATNKAWFLAIILTSVMFGFAHLYQGTSGVITTGIISLIFGFIFYRNQNNLTLAMFTHGFYDVIGITLIYLNQERTIVEFVKELIL